MPGPEKRLPGQTNADYGRRRDANADFLGTQSLRGGGDPTWALRLVRALFERWDRRKNRR